MTFLSPLLNLQHQLVPCLQFKLPIALREYIPKSSTSGPPSVLSLLSTNQRGPGHFQVSPEELMAGEQLGSCLMPDDHTDIIIFVSCLRPLSSKLSLPRPGSSSQPSTASLLPALVSWIWICLCCFPVNLRLLAAASFSVPGQLELFTRSHPLTCLYAWYCSEVVGTKHSFLISHLKFPGGTLLSVAQNYDSICLSLCKVFLWVLGWRSARHIWGLVADLVWPDCRCGMILTSLFSQGTKQIGKSFWLSLNNQCPVSKYHHHAQHGCLASFLLGFQ